VLRPRAFKGLSGFTLVLPPPCSVQMGGDLVLADPLSYNVLRTYTHHQRIWCPRVWGSTMMVVLAREVLSSDVSLSYSLSLSCHRLSLQGDYPAAAQGGM
jgi:hypothetical protein